MRYPGGKGGAGVFQTIINLIPPHTRYFELFAGGANIYARKAPAATSILLELDSTQAAVLASTHAARRETIVMQRCGISSLQTWRFAPGDFLYLDPPYLHETRSRVDLYTCELSNEQHAQILAALAALGRGVPFILSGYRSRLYDDAAAAAGWARADFPAMTRGGLRIESAWFNYDPPSTLAEYSFIGKDFRERERIKRKVARWTSRIDKLAPLERAALRTAIKEKENHANV